MRRTALALAVALLALAGCGGGAAGDGAAKPVARVDVPGQVLALSVEPGGGALLISTDRGTYRVAPDGGRAQALDGALRTDSGVIEVGRRVVAAALAPNHLLASGHPDHRADRPVDLGLMSSTNEGRTWTLVSLLGAADLHLLRVLGRRLYAFDLTHQRFVGSTDAGRTWSTHPAPGLMLDVAVDPGDRQHLVAVSSEGVLASRDAGATWRPLGSGFGTRLAWASADALFEIDDGGLVRRSRDGGGTADVVGSLGTRPQAAAAGPDGTRYVAGADGVVRVCRDDGARWSAHMRLR